MNYVDPTGNWWDYADSSRWTDMGNNNKRAGVEYHIRQSVIRDNQGGLLFRVEQDTYNDTTNKTGGVTYWSHYEPKKDPDPVNKDNFWKGTLEAINRAGFPTPAGVVPFSIPATFSHLPEDEAWRQWTGFVSGESIGNAIGGTIIFGGVGINALISKIVWSKGGVVVIGSAPYFIEKAKEVGAKYFTVSQKLLNQLPESLQTIWQANRAFLDKAIEKGYSFLLSTDPYSPGLTKGFAAELDYIKGKGYEIVKYVADGIVTYWLEKQ